MIRIGRAGTGVGVGTVIVTAVLVAGCAGEGERPAANAAGDVEAAGDTAAQRMATLTEGLQHPESAIYDADQNVWFVTNINGNPPEKDNNGFISLVRADGTMDSLKFVAGGRDDVTLHAPKGQAIVGDTLWVTDIDAVRGFNKRTGAPVRAVEFGDRAIFLNDIAVGPDGALYVTDTGGETTESGKIFRVSGGEITVAAEGAELQGPNGITWDAADERFVVVPFKGTALLAFTPGAAPERIGTGPGQQDGVEVLGEGQLLISSWTDSTLFLAVNGANRTVIRDVPSPADIGIDPATNRVAIPMLMENRLELWQLPERR